MRTLALFLLLATLPAIPTVRPTPETGFRGDPAHGGLFPGKAPTHGWEIAWLAPTDGTIRSSPAVAAGMVYFGSGDGALHAVEARTGKEKWRFATGGSVSSSPAVAGGRVFFSSHDRRLYALDAGSGRLLWRFELGEDVPFIWGWDYFLSSPAIAGGRVYVGSGDGHLYALEAATGRLAWRFKTGGRVRSSPAVAGGVVYVGSMDGSLYAVAADSGKPVWKFDTEGTTLDSAKFGYDRTSVQSSPAVADTTVVFGCRDGHLYAVDRETGHLKWRFDHETSWVASSPALFEDLVLVGSSDGHFYQAVELATGKERWRHATGSNVYSSGAVADGAVFFGTQEGTFFALDARTGEERWRFHAGSRVFSSPAVADGVLYFGSDDGSLYALTSPKLEGAAKSPVQRAVFWNEKTVGKWFHGDTEARDFFVVTGYRLLGTADLAGFLHERTVDHAPSVVIFASDVLPEPVAPRGGEAPLLRQYLEAGGKAVWLGMPPLLFEFDPVTGARGPSTKTRATRLLGVNHGNIRANEYGALPTAEGARWGLRTRWGAPMAVAPEDVTTVLALDEDGKAAAWVKGYGGPEGTGFVRLWGRENACLDLVSVEAVAEHGLP